MDRLKTIFPFIFFLLASTGCLPDKDVFDSLFKNCVSSNFPDWLIFYSRFDSLQRQSGMSDYVLSLRYAEEGRLKNRINLDSLWSDRHSFNNIYSPVNAKVLFDCMRSQSPESISDDLDLVIQLLSQPLAYEATGKMNWN